MALLTTNYASLVMGFSEIVKFQARQRVLISLFHRTEVAFVKIFMCKAYFVFRCETEFSPRPSCSLCFPSNPYQAEHLKSEGLGTVFCWGLSPEL